MGSKTKIDWCDATWNPVTGCLHGCEYCYARKIAERFGSHQMPIFVDYPVLHEPVRCTSTYEYMRDLGINEGAIQPYPFDFTPTFHEYRLDIPKGWKKPRTIFVCSMADLFGKWVEDQWISTVMDACLAAPQHRYLFLTKNPARYFELAKKGRLVDQSNFWYGTSVTRPNHQFFFETPFFTNKVRSHSYGIFLSIEPILESFPVQTTFRREEGQQNCIDWMICGAETGNRKGKVKPEREWIENLMETSRLTGVPLFMKESLREIVGDDFRQEFPW